MTPPFHPEEVYQADLGVVDDRGMARVESVRCLGLWDFHTLVERRMLLVRFPGHVGCLVMAHQKKGLSESRLSSHLMERSVKSPGRSKLLGAAWKVIMRGVKGAGAEGKRLLRQVGALIKTIAGMESQLPLKPVWGGLPRADENGRIIDEPPSYDEEEKQIIALREPLSQFLKDTQEIRRQSRKQGADTAVQRKRACPSCLFQCVPGAAWVFQE